MDASLSAGVRKREQIKRANRMMFLWIAGVSAIVGVCVVLSIFLVQQILFNEKVLAEKAKTVETLKKNLSVVSQLEENINVLNTNKALISTRLNEDDTAVQSVLDAVPAAANSTSLAASLQTKLLAGVPGVVLDKLSVNPVGGAETGSGAIDVAQADTEAGVNQISYSFSMSANANNYAALRQVLERVEKSIRPFNNNSVTVDVQNNSVTMTVSGVGYFEPAKTIETVNKVVKQ